MDFFSLLRDRKIAAAFEAGGKLAAQMLSDPSASAGSLEKIQSVWADATQDVVYYKNLVEAGEAPAALETWDDFHKIPLLRREILQSRLSEFRRLSGPPEDYRMTGGSTGEPVRLGVWKSEAEPQRVAKMALWSRCGYKPGKKLLLIWGHSHLLGTGWTGRKNHVLRKIKDRLLGYIRIDAYTLSPAKCEKIARTILATKPTGIIGYASALDYLARTTENFHQAFAKVGVSFVMPASENPPHEDTFDLLERIFNCPVIQEFGGVEFGQVAMKHGHEPFLVFPHLNYFETIAGVDSGTEGEGVVLTSLIPRYIPLIRYVQGDSIAGIERLATGHVRAFEKLMGRTNDFLTLANGTAVHSVAVMHCIHQEKAVVNIQLAWRDEGLVLRLVTSPVYDVECEKRIRSRLAQVSPTLGDIPFELVTDVKPTRAGKRRWVVDERTSK